MLSLHINNIAEINLDWKKKRHAKFFRDPIYNISMLQSNNTIQTIIFDWFSSCASHSLISFTRVYMKDLKDGTMTEENLLQSLND